MSVCSAFLHWKASPLILGFSPESHLASISIPELPWSWYYAGHLRDMDPGPVRHEIGGRPFALFRGKDGEISALDARCVHLGADLSRGCVVDGNLRCPFHEWSFAGDGRCVHIPAATAIPDFARQAAFPTAVRGGHAFVFNRPHASFDFPFFDGVTPNDLRPARPFDLELETDWPMVAANAFDLQHFRTAHDRTLIDEPTVDNPAPHACRIRATFAVTGNGLRDRLTRRVSGSRVTMTVTCWGGTVVLVSAEFRRTTSYGMVCVTPIAPGRCHLRTIVWVPRSRGPLGRALFDPVDAAVRRSFIRAFVRADQERSAGIEYNPASLIDADATLARYFEWLGATVRGESFAGQKGSHAD